MPVNRHFDLLAPLYDRLIAPPDLERMRALLELPGDGEPPAPGWMLDAGGGTGRGSAPLCPPVERLVVCDLSPGMLNQASAKGCLLAARARAHRLPFPDGTFNRVLVTDAFHHFGDQPACIAELARVLAPGGRMVIEEPDIRRAPVKLVALAETLMLMGSRFRPPAWIREQLAALGLDAAVETEGVTAWVIARKPLLITHH